MTTSSHRLIVMRHAKAEQVAATDHERELAPRGVQDAAAAGRWAAREGYLPDHAVVSSAARTQGTWRSFARASGAVSELVTDRALYSAGTDGALEILRMLPDEVGTAMLVGHNPTMEYLVHLLDDGGAAPELFAQVSAGYPTAAMSVLELPGPWSSVDVGCARIVDFHVGRA